MSAEVEVIGWQVVDPDGNVVQSGGVTQAFAAGAVAEVFDQLEEEK